MDDFCTRDLNSAGGIGSEMSGWRWRHDAAPWYVIIIVKCHDFYADDSGHLCVRTVIEISRFSRCEKIFRLKKKKKKKLVDDFCADDTGMWYRAVISKSATSRDGKKFFAYKKKNWWMILRGRNDNSMLNWTKLHLALRKKFFAYNILFQEA